MLPEIKNAKTKMLDTLKTERAALDVAQQRLADEKYADKRVAADKRCQELTVAFDKYKQEKLAKLNEEFTEMSKKVEANKAEVLATARQEAENEAAAETATVIAEYDNEISKLEAELA